MEPVERLSRSTEPLPGMRGIADHIGLSMAFKSDHKDIAARATAGLGEITWEGAAAGENSTR